jgi:DNA invertase Pin-like site-specific DNA recombinase
MTTDELLAIEHADERAAKAQDALVRARVFDRDVTRIRDDALRAMRADGMSYGQISTLTGVNRSTVISATRTVDVGNSVDVGEADL